MFLINVSITPNNSVITQIKAQIIMIKNAIIKRSGAEVLNYWKMLIDTENKDKVLDEKGKEN